MAEQLSAYLAAHGYTITAGGWQRGPIRVIFPPMTTRVIITWPSGRELFPGGTSEAAIIDTLRTIDALVGTSHG